MWLMVVYTTIAAICIIINNYNININNYSMTVQQAEVDRYSYHNVRNMTMKGVR